MTTRAAERAGDTAIVVCANGKYFPPAYLICMSLMREQPERYDVHLLTEAGPHLDLVPRDVPFTIQTPDFVSRLPDIPSAILEFRTPFTYLRLFLPELFEGYRRILYLDCDIRIDGSIAPLLRLDMKGAPIAAADDIMTFCRFGLGAEMPQPHLSALGFEPKEPYFNSGVLLIDCERWKRDQMTRTAIDCLARLGPLAALGDQDPLNVAFRTQWLPLSPRWNFPALAYETGVETVIKPVLYHHTFYKPWIFGRAIRRETKKFRDAMRNTPYRKFKETLSFYQMKRLAEGNAKRLIQNATPFVPSSRKRIDDRDPRNIERQVAAYIIRSVQARRFADVDQGLSVIDVGALAPLARVT